MSKKIYSKVCKPSNSIQTVVSIDMYGKFNEDENENDEHFMY